MSAATALASASIISRAIRSSAASIGFSRLKPQQNEVVLQFVKDHDVFVVLPTGYGKSLCYACLPLVFDALKKRFDSIVIVITPLIAIMKDQVDKYNSLGLKTAYVSGETQQDADMVEGVVQGRYKIVFFSPEMVRLKKWRKVLMNDVYQDRLVGLAIDEAHCVKNWWVHVAITLVMHLYTCNNLCLYRGDTFRTAYNSIGELRSLISPAVNIMALTATAIKSTRSVVSKRLGMRSPVVISVSPCRLNVKYVVSAFKSIEDNFLPVLDKVKSEFTQMGRVIIYCQRIQDCATLYSFFKENLGPYFLSPTDAPDLSCYRVVDMFTSITDPLVKTQIVKSFTTPSSPLRIVIGTTAFGMGIDCSDVSAIINLGPPENLDAYIQQTGRAGRDGTNAKAIIF